MSWWLYRPPPNGHLMMMYINFMLNTPMFCSFYAPVYRMNASRVIPGLLKQTLNPGNE